LALRRLHNGSKLLRWLSKLVLLCSLYSLGLAADSSELRAVRHLLQTGEYLTALTLIEDLKDLRPCDADLLFIQARVYETIGETDIAISLYQFLINNFPTLPEPYNNIAVLYADRGKVEEAKTFLRRGLSTNESYQRLQKNLTTIYVVEAAEAYRRALNLQIQQEASSVSTPPTPKLLEAEALLKSSSNPITATVNMVCQHNNQ
jgi:Flp pilus assembly protein TadD